MEKNSKEHTTTPPTMKHRSYFVIKVILLLLCAIVVVQFAVVAKCFESLKAINNRLKAIEEEKSLDSRSLENKENGPGTRRAKRSTETDIKKALAKLEKLEGRINQSYQYVGRQPAFVLRGPPGQPGTPGKSGRDGRDGRDGAQGARGDSGVPGPRGLVGPRGLKGIQGKSGKVGVTYIRWGKKICPNTGATLVYEGYVGGSHYSHRGGASNYVCLPRDPIYEKYQHGPHAYRSGMYGAEYQTYSTGIYPNSLHDHDVPCSVCHVTRRASQMMIPGRNVCPAGWTREYKGYLMTERYNHHRTMFACVDEHPDYTHGTHANVDGAMFFFVEGVCGSLPCGPYIAGREMTCAVCSR